MESLILRTIIRDPVKSVRLKPPLHFVSTCKHSLFADQFGEVVHVCEIASSHPAKQGKQLSDSRFLGCGFRPERGPREHPGPCVFG